MTLSARIPRSEIALLFEGIDHAEGVAIGADGSVWCGGEEGQVYCGHIDGSFTEITRLPGRTLGIALDSGGNAFCCCMGEQSGLFRVTPTGETSHVTSGTVDRPCIEANFPAFLPDGSLLFTDAGHWGEDDGCILAVAPAGETSIASDVCFRYPNGLAVSPDRSFLAVVESTLPGISGVSIGRDGSLGARRVLVETPGLIPDGVAFDASGGLLISCWTPDAIFFFANSRLECLVEDDRRFLLSSPTNIAFVPNTHTVVCANYGERFLSKFEHAQPGAPLPTPSLSGRTS